MQIRAADSADYGEMYTLQRAAFVDEAQLYGTPDVPSLNITFDEFKDKLSKCHAWVALDKNRIIGAVSLCTKGEIPDIERLMVAPDRRGEGIGSKLLKVLELAAIDAGHKALQLTVGDLAGDTQLIYEHLGWRKADSFHLEGFERVLLHKMTKMLIVPA